MNIKDISGIILFFLFSFSVTQAQIYVDANATGTNNGSSWANAFTELHSATAIAGYGAQIWVAKGTYFPTSGTNRDISFHIANGVELYGGFAGGETSVGQRNWNTNVTILSGDIGTSGSPTDNSYNVVEYPNTSITGKMDGFIVQDGYATGPYQVNGAAVMINAYGTNLNGSIEFRNNVFVNNYASGNGGAVYMEAGNNGSLQPVFVSCKFLGNNTGSSGGAVYHSAYNGGYIASIFSKCTFLQNQSNESGAAIFNHGGGGKCVPQFTHCDFESNASNVGHGGAMYNLGTGLNSNSSPIITNCRFFKNSGFAAGAIYNNGTSNGNSSPVITNSTFVANFINANGLAGGGGGTIYNNGSVDGNSSTEVVNCIVWGNSAPHGTHVFKNVEGTPTISYSLIDQPDCTSLNTSLGSTVTCGGGIQYNIDPLFLNEAGGDLRLQDASPAINTGDNSKNTVSIDLDGVARIANSLIDKGAYENFSVVLPIELGQFTAEARGEEVFLKWNTLSELDNDYFTIEHSIDGHSFEPIFEIKGAGNSIETNHYQVVDTKPVRGINYYRLVQTDFDGTSTKSNIVNVLFESGVQAVFPNPVKNVLYVSTENFEPHEVHFSIFDILGNRITQQTLEVVNGRFEIKEVENLSIGTYFIKITTNGQDDFVQKIQKL